MAATMWQRRATWPAEAALAATWRAATPFPHLILDDVIAADAVAALLEIIEDEPAARYEGDIFAFEASPPQPSTAAFRQLRDEFAATFAPLLRAITGRAVARADMRAFAYGPGHYLLPHTDHQPGLGRVLAYAFYVPSPAPPTGGELELFRCELDDGALRVTEPAGTIAPTANRLVVFEVGDASLHQVREVLAGLRLSLAGWFYP
jgi:hypothetical protein